jgi:peptidoglycan/LPS O-acetylase OafA/YrhL
MIGQRSRLPSLDGLRAISIGLVLIDHVSLTPGFPLPTEVTERWGEALGGLGVRVFFVISGFLITTLLLDELNIRGTIHLWRFYFRRTLRIFLPFYACVGTMLLLQGPGVVSLTRGDVVHALTYTMNYFSERSWDLGHAWSLSVEEQFYLLWPAILLLGGPRRGLWMAAGLVVLAPIIRIVYFYLAPDLVPYEVSYRFETVGDALASGCLLAGLAGWLNRQPLYRRCLESKLFMVVPILVAYAAMIAPSARTGLLVGVTVQNVGIAACVAWCLANYSGRVGRLLNSRPLVGLGLMSYSLYLWQQPFTNPWSTSPLSRFPLNLALLAAASLASFYLVERPALGWRRRLERWLFPNHELVTETPSLSPRRSVV